MDLMEHEVRPGKILRIKNGFNPNSSSIGSIIFSLPVSLMAATAGFAAISALVLQHVIRMPSDAVQKEEETDLDGADEHSAHGHSSDANG
jgi:hypothetical protein